MGESFPDDSSSDNFTILYELERGYYLGKDPLMNLVSRRFSSVAVGFSTSWPLSYFKTYLLLSIAILQIISSTIFVTIKFGIKSISRDVNVLKDFLLLKVGPLIVERLISI